MKLAAGTREAGSRSHPLYPRWHEMLERCLNPKHMNYHKYGARGIGVCDRWRSFSAFVADMGMPPAPRLTLERIDNDRGYEPGNCRWATYKEQARNTRQNVLITWNGETKILTEWAETLGVKPITLHGRLYKSRWPIEKAFTESVKARANLSQGATHCIYGHPLTKENVYRRPKKPSDWYCRACKRDSQNKHYREVAGIRLRENEGGEESE